MLWERRERDFRTHPAAASIAAGLAVTLGDLLLLLAVNAGEARWTGAGVAALAGVHAPGPVSAGLVVCAVVEVCDNKRVVSATAIERSVLLRLRRPLRTLIAKDAPPALLAFAVPRLFTGTMLADGVGLTHVTKEALPAFAAPVCMYNNKTFLTHRAMLVHGKDNKHRRIYPQMKRPKHHSVV